MLSNFSDVPVRSNGRTGGPVTNAWWNSLRTAGIAVEAILNALVGAGGSTSEQSLAIADAQAVAANITGMIASSSYRCTRIRYTIKRVADSTVVEHGELVILYNGTTFELYQPWFVGSPAGVTFSIDTGTGQVQYTSDDMPGTYDAANSKIFWNVTTQG